MQGMLALPSTKRSDNVNPWLSYNGLNEVTSVKLVGQELVVDYIP